MGVHPRWQRVVDFAKEMNVPISIGVMGKTLSNGGQAFTNWIIDQQKLGNIEFWNHGLIHKRHVENGQMISEFNNSTLEKQIEYLNNSQVLAKEKLGFEFTTFGAPYNQTDSNTIKALEHFPEIKNWYYPHPQAVNKTHKQCFMRIHTLNIEYPVHKPSFYYLWNNLYFHRHNNTIVLQGHPLSWDDKRFTEFKYIVRYLKGQGFQFATPSQLK